MTQDQYGQVRGDVADDENDDYPSDQSKPMTRFQKVASALRGDRPDDSRETEEDQVPGGHLDPNYSTDAGSDPGPGAHPGADTDRGTYPGTVTDPSEVTDPNGMTTPGHGGVSDVTTNPDTTTAIREGQAGSSGQSVWDARSDPDSSDLDSTATGTQRGDYWEVPDPREEHVAAVTTPETPFAETGTNPLPYQDETRPDIPETQESTEADAYAPHGTSAGTAAADTTATDTTAMGTGHTDTVAADAVHAHDGVGTTVAGDTAGADAVPADAVPADAVPADATAGDAVAQDAGATGRHAAAAPAAQDKRPGEAAGDLGDLGDLAYGKLVPDAAQFTDQWQQIKSRFVDDPQGSVTEAAEVVAQVTAKVEAAIQERLQAIQARQEAIQERQRSLRGRWGEGSQADTETLRETLRMYRAFLDQLIGQA